MACFFIRTDTIQNKYKHPCLDFKWPTISNSRNIIIMREYTLINLIATRHFYQNLTQIQISQTSLNNQIINELHNLPLIIPWSIKTQLSKKGKGCIYVDKLNMVGCILPLPKWLYRTTTYYNVMSVYYGCLPSSNQLMFMCST